MKTALFLLVVTVLAGCATGTDLQGGDLRSDLLGAAVGPITKQVLGLAVEDAKTTLTWIEREENAGHLSKDDAVTARACPLAVLEFAELREAIISPSTVPGFKGILYNATVAKFGTKTHVEKAKQAVGKLLAACSDLAPTQIIGGF